MFESLKRTLGYIPDSINILANFDFIGNYEIIDNEVQVKHMEKIDIILTHKIFRLGQELEINTLRANSIKCYYVAKQPYLDKKYNQIFEVVDKINNSKFTMILDALKNSLQIINHSNIAEKIIFSRNNLSKPDLSEALNLKYSLIVEECLQELNDIIDNYHKTIDNIILYDYIRNVDKLITIRHEILLCCVRITYSTIQDKMLLVAKEVVTETEKCHKNLLAGSDYGNLIGLNRAFERVRLFIIRYADVVQNLEDDNLI